MAACEAAVREELLRTERLLADARGNAAVPLRRAQTLRLLVRDKAEADG